MSFLVVWSSQYSQVVLFDGSYSEDFSCVDPRSHNPDPNLAVPHNGDILVPRNEGGTLVARSELVVLGDKLHTYIEDR
jgi:hypothetical protein